MDNLEKYVAGLTQDQRNYLLTGKGSPRGLVQRGLLAFRWGNNASMGYITTLKGAKVRDFLKQQSA
jgi:hypothetical protein